MEIDIVITFFNAENFIDDVFNGILIQNKKLINKIVLINDASVDRTDLLINKWINILQHVNIEYIVNSTNLGTFLSLNLALSKCKSPFVALIEGDDYWIDANKLDVQLQVMKADLTLSGVGSNSKIVSNENVWEGRYYSNLSNGKLYFNDLVGPPPFQLSSFVFRRKLLPLLPKAFSNTICNDKLLYTLLSLSGPIFYSDRVFAVYRLNSKGINLSTEFYNKFKEQKIYYQKLNDYLNGNYNYLISMALFQHLKGCVIETKANKIENQFSMKEIFQIWYSAFKSNMLGGLRDLLSIFNTIYFK